MDIRVKSFVPEATGRLDFLCTEYGFTGPEVVPDEAGVYPLLRSHGRGPRRPVAVRRGGAAYRSVPRGLSDFGSAAQPYREAVVGVLECDVDVELMDDP